MTPRTWESKKVERLEGERDKWEREARLQKEGGLRERKVADSYYQSLVKARQQVADLQAQLAAARIEIANRAHCEKGLAKTRDELQQQVAQLREELEQWKSVASIRNVHALQTAHTTLRGLVRDAANAPGQHWLDWQLKLCEALKDTLPREGGRNE